MVITLGQPLHYHPATRPRTTKASDQTDCCNFQTLSPELNDSLKKPTARPGAPGLRGIYGFSPFRIACRPTRCFFETLSLPAGTGDEPVQL